MAEAADSTSDMGFTTDGTWHWAGYEEQGARGGSQRGADVTDVTFPAYESSWLIICDVCLLSVDRNWLTSKSIRQNLEVPTFQSTKAKTVWSTYCRVCITYVEYFYASARLYRQRKQYAIQLWSLLLPVCPSVCLLSVIGMRGMHDKHFGARAYKAT